MRVVLTQYQTFVTSFERWRQSLGGKAAKWTPSNLVHGCLVDGTCPNKAKQSKGMSARNIACPAHH
jgi:hypothetical protein